MVMGSRCKKELSSGRIGKANATNRACAGKRRAGERAGGKSLASVNTASHNFWALTLEASVVNACGKPPTEAQQLRNYRAAALVSQTKALFANALESCYESPELRSFKCSC